MLKTNWTYHIFLILLLCVCIVFVVLIFNIKPDQTSIRYVFLGGGIFSALFLVVVLAYLVLSQINRGEKDLQPVLVLGDDHSGKERLVETYTERHIAQRIYPQIMPSAALRDHSRQTRGNMQRLWSTLFATQVPRVVIALNGADLSSVSSEALTDLAERMKEKIEMLSNIRKSAEVDVALTYMEQIDGYAAFAELLSTKNIPLKLQAWDSLETQVSHYKQYLSIALTTLSAEAFLQLLAFFHHAPERLAPFTDFVSALQTLPGSQPMRVFFTSSQGLERAISNPFADA